MSTRRKEVPLWASLLIIAVISMAMIAMALKAPGIMFIVISGMIKIIQTILSVFLQIAVLLLIVLLILGFFLLKGSFPNLGALIARRFENTPGATGSGVTLSSDSAADLKKNKKLAVDAIDVFYAKSIYDIKENTGVPSRSRQKELLSALQNLGFEFEMMDNAASGEKSVSVETDNNSGFIPTQVRSPRAKKIGSSQRRATRLANKKISDAITIT